MKWRWILVAVLLPGLAPRTLEGADWPQFRGPERDGVSMETGLRKTWPEGGPPLLWTYKDAGLGYSGPAVVGDRLYLAGARRTPAGDRDREYVFGLDLKTAPGQPPREVWSAPIGPLFRWNGNQWNAGPNATPTVAGDLVFALGGFGDLVCVEAATG